MSRGRSPRYVRAMLWGGGGLVLAAVAWALFVTGRIRLTVHNETGRRLTSLIAEVTGERVLVGDLEPGTRGRCTLEPRGDSGLALSYRTDEGVPGHVEIDVYLMEGSTGTIEVWIETDGRQRFEMHEWWPLSGPALRRVLAW